MPEISKNISVKDGDVLLVTTTDEHFSSFSEDWLTNLEVSLKGKTVVLILSSPSHPVDIRLIDERDMNKAGWYRRAGRYR